MEQALYEIRKKIYPRAVTGKFSLALVLRLGHAAGVLRHALAHLERPAGGAVRSRRAQVLHLRPGVLAAGHRLPDRLLIICAYSLFLFTAVAGRLWCGYACPQTVYTEIFMWIERKVEGDRMARMKLDKQPLSAAQARDSKPLKHAIWIALALWTGFTFVGYFTPIKTLWRMKC